MVTTDDIVTWIDNDGTERRGYVTTTNPRNRTAIIELTDIPGPPDTIHLPYDMLTVHRDWDRHQIIATDIRAWRTSEPNGYPRHALIEAFPEGKITPTFRIRLDGTDLDHYATNPVQVTADYVRRQGYTITKRGLTYHDRAGDTEQHHQITGHAYPTNQ